MQFAVKVWNAGWKKWADGDACLIPALTNVCGSLIHLEFAVLNTGHADNSNLASVWVSGFNFNFNMAARLRAV